MNDDKPEKGTEIPIPPDFPVEWENEDEHKLLWRWDDTHSPLPATEMSISIGDSQAKLNPGLTKKTFKTPNRGQRKRINGYSYSTTAAYDPTPDEKQEQDSSMDAAIGATRNRWDEEFLPAIEKNLAYMRHLDLNAASDDQLLEYLDEFLKFNAIHWDIHMMVVSPMHTIVERVANAYRQALPEVPEVEPYILFQGIDNKSLETDRALQSLADYARELAEVATLFASDAPVDLLVEQFSQTDEGSEFLTKLNEFLAVYGYRPTGFDYIFPTWIEDPTFVLMNVRAYLSRPPRQQEADHVDVNARTEQYLAKVLEQLDGDSSAREKFLIDYEHARQLWHLKEDHAFYIDQGNNATMRILIAEMGKRVVRKGYLDRNDDVFYLNLDELREGMRSDCTSDLRAYVGPRRENRERFMKIIPPPFIGTMPDDAESASASPFASLIGPVSAFRPDQGATALRGIAGSRGTATGTAKVVRSPDEFGKIAPGDILVCTSTSPTWTPLFATVSALVSDSGGVLSHTAIVAREYELPAVVGVKFATSIIRDGQVITVDGDTGTVLLR